MTVEGLVDAGLIERSEAPVMAAVTNNFSLRVTPHVLELIQTRDPSDPIFAQYVPSADELREAPGELADPIGDGLDPFA